MSVMQITVFQLASIYKAEAKAFVSCKRHIESQLGICWSCRIEQECSTEKIHMFVVYIAMP